jgi:chromosome segregation ATPase
MKTKYESIENKEKDLQHYLNLLKESISTKDQQLLIVQSEINDLRNRIRDKEAAIEKKQQQIQTFQVDKHQRDSDILELKDQMDIKERKLNVLNRKIDNLEEQLKDKEIQIQTLRAKIGTNNNANFTNEIINLEHVIGEKEKLIEKLNQSKTTSKDELDRLNENIQELKDLNEKKDKEIVDYQVNL